jgi:hypothetical protein
MMLLAQLHFIISLISGIVYFVSLSPVAFRLGFSLARRRFFIRLTFRLNTRILIALRLF